ncbi:MAG: phosphate acyltransferase PlsX [Oscillospiraceae bacterium]|jgi:glycerol-3-phosphate acyltransferase PlsX|nr:phosphate acyltransferase PlsX [Oscillospiraceae bacterium]
MKVILDVMGGDNAPAALVRGALLAREEQQTDIIMVGLGEEILRLVRDEGLPDLPKGLEIAHASQVIGMHENPAAAVREKSDSSVVVGLTMLAAGQGGAFVSAGSTGALLTAATLIVKRIRGIRRAALAPVLPTAKGGALLIDCGANIECAPEYLLQFALMGSCYAQRAMGVETPRVGLLNIGAEATKGDELHRAAHALLRRAGDEGRIHFVGNVEARDIAFGAADVVVSDGFSGNILLKTMEGVGLFFVDGMKAMFKARARTKLAALLVKDGLGAFRRMIDYTEYGGAPFVGVTAPVVKAHGSSDARAIASAIRQAAAFASSGVIEAIVEHIEQLKVTDA